MTTTENTEIPEATAIIVTSGDQRGQCLVRIEADGRVHADVRRDPREAWVPVECYGGSVEVRDPDGCEVGGLVVLSPDSFDGGKFADGGWQQGGRVRVAVLVVLFVATMLALAVSQANGGTW